ncbi:TetR/AcrR family transcriptional regulator [Agromyces marinus]|uniref:HTH tetR-type domain-containing protein n=1 Tax=Agromyces marinus TaxID=1389020 RepID=A0ABN6YD98_9MICO|nr:TetR/AcrR family transcriptional regulator [Agromyces marinus]UIP57802.1 hypothetical protein DSM26151_06680 [Agromyces marinus]BDZ54016.1 hypothetical protein GCM10025870_10890 [Agromyces marinus]
MPDLDPRRARTRSALRSAALAAAGRTPLADLTVAGVARAAGVSRDTFYRHVASVADLVAEALAEALDDPVAEFEGFRGPGRERFALAEHRLFDHVAEHRAVYLHALDGRLAEPVRGMLVDRVEGALTTYLRANPGVAPLTAGDLTAGEHHAIYAAYAAAGTVGVIEHWLRRGATGDADDIASGVLAVSAPWWWGPEP